MVRFKQLCQKCKKNMVLVTSKTKFAICYDCQKEDLQGEIKDPKMKKMFDIPEEFYKENSFLRDIKIRYLKFKELSEKQIAAFEKTVKELKENKKE